MPPCLWIRARRSSWEACLVRSRLVSWDAPPASAPLWTNVFLSLSRFDCPAVELAMIMDRLYGGVCYAGIDTDPELKYPKGAGRVAFSNQQSYIAAISARFVQLQHGDIEKRVSSAGVASWRQLTQGGAGRSEALRLGRSNLRRVSGWKVRRQVCPLLLCKRDVSAVLLRTLLGYDPLASRT